MKDCAMKLKCHLVFLFFSMGSLPVGVHNIICHKLLPLGSISCRSAQGTSIFLHQSTRSSVCPSSVGRLCYFCQKFYRRWTCFNLNLHHMSPSEQIGWSHMTWPTFNVTKSNTNYKVSPAEYHTDNLSKSHTQVCWQVTSLLAGHGLCRHAHL